MIVEDDNKLRELIGRQLEKYGYSVVLPEDFSSLKAEFLKLSPQLILMDINLPYFDGFYWCRDIRTVSKVPIIFISARNSDMDQVLAIDNGGDDYITKPFSYDLLIAKVKGVIRRVYGEYSEPTSHEMLEANGLYMNISKNTLEYCGRSIELSKRETQLLHALLKKVNSIVLREELLEILWNDVDFVDDNTLSVNMTRVRKRLEEIGLSDVIETRRGQGYLLLDKWK